MSYDRLTDWASSLHSTNPARCGIVMIESLEKGIRTQYHKRRLAMPYAALRERARVAIEELVRVPRPDFEPAGKR